MTPNRWIAAASAAVFAVLGVAGIAATALTAPDVPPLALAFFGTSYPLAALHLLVAAVLAVGAIRGDALARQLNTGIGVLLIVLGMFGLFAIGTPANVIGLNGADNVVHFAASTVLLAAGLGAARARKPRVSTPSE